MFISLQIIKLYTHIKQLYGYIAVNFLIICLHQAFLQSFVAFLRRLGFILEITGLQVSFCQSFNFWYHRKTSCNNVRFFFEEKYHQSHIKAHVCIKPSAHGKTADGQSDEMGLLTILFFGSQVDLSVWSGLFRQP